MKHSRRRIAIFVGVLLVGSFVYLTDSRAYLDGSKRIRVVLKSGSKKEIRSVKYLVTSTHESAELYIANLAEVDWKSALAGEVSGGSFECSVPISRTIRGPFGFGITESYSNYSGLVLLVELADGSTQPLATPIPGLRYQSTPLVLTIGVD
jgi:hypothetical protein